MRFAPRNGPSTRLNNKTFRTDSKGEALNNPDVKAAYEKAAPAFAIKRKRLIPLHPVTQYEGATQLSVGERVVGRESALCLGLSWVAPLRV